jgi:hypothetical protein
VLKQPSYLIKRKKEEPIMRDPAIDALHRKHMAFVLDSKVRELAFFLSMMKRGGSSAMALYTAGFPKRDPVNPEHEEQFRQNFRDVSFGCSAFCNTIQTLKDAVASIIQEKIEWKDIKACRHGDFIYEIRNASTHDGFPTCDTYADGRYYFLATRVRFGQQDKLVTIIPPSADVVTCCSEFAHDWCQFLVQKLKPHIGKNELLGSLFTPDSLDDVWGSTDVLPSFAVKLYHEFRETLHAHIDKEREDPILQAIEELNKVIAANVVR